MPRNQRPEEQSRIPPQCPYPGTEFSWSAESEHSGGRVRELRRKEKYGDGGGEGGGRVAGGCSQLDPPDSAGIWLGLGPGLLPAVRESESPHSGEPGGPKFQIPHTEGSLGASAGLLPP